MLNFIPYNPTDVIAGHESPEMEDIQAMNTILREEYGMTTTVRQEMGSDIADCMRTVGDFSQRKESFDDDKDEDARHGGQR